MKNVKLAIICTIPIPSAKAAANRILSYSKGLVECGDSVDVLTSGKSISGESLRNIDGVTAINYGTSNPFSLVLSLIKILARIVRCKYDVVLAYSNSLLLLYPLFIICKMTGKKFVHEKNEFPFALMKKGVFNRINAYFRVNTTFKLFDGLIVMTKPLYNYFKPKARKKCKFILLPMTVDVSRFDIEKGTDDKLGDYIAYCGDMSGNKDGVVNLIEAFRIVEDKRKDIKLVLIGGTRNKELYQDLQNKVCDWGLQNVVFYGWIDRNDMPQILKNAKLLALARPTSLQSAGGFPTKLGEYLATGNPVVVTAVGEIPDYLNRTNSYIVPPDDNTAFANAILEILDDYTKAQRIGLEGQKLAFDVFNYQVQSKRLHQYLTEL